MATPSGDYYSSPYLTFLVARKTKNMNEERFFRWRLNSIPSRFLRGGYAPLRQLITCDQTLPIRWNAILFEVQLEWCSPFESPVVLISRLILIQGDVVVLIRCNGERCVFGEDSVIWMEQKSKRPLSVSDEANFMRDKTNIFTGGMLSFPLSTKSHSYESSLSLSVVVSSLSDFSATRYFSAELL